MKNVLMIVYTDFYHDARVRREAETLAFTYKYEVSILVPKEGSSPRTSEVNRLRLIEVDEMKYQGKSKIGYVFSYLKFMVLCFVECSRLFLKGEVDIVHVHNMPDFLVLSGILPRLFGRNIVLDIHDSMPETYSSKFTGKSSLSFKLMCVEESISASLAQRIICVNHVQKEVLVGRGIPPAKITVLMNVPDPRLFPVSGKQIQSQPRNDGFRMVYHGTVANRLGVDLAVQAVARLSGLIPDLEFHLWSKAGQALDEIERMSRSLNVADRVRILRGGVPLERLAQELRIMDLGVVGNRKGIATDLMLPVKMLEYMALGIPVVASRLKCIQYYFDENMVSFFEPDNVDSMAEAILELYRNPAKGRRQAENARKFLDRYGWQNHRNDLIRMYETL